MADNDVRKWVKMSLKTLDNEDTYSFIMFNFFSFQNLFTQLCR